MAKASKGNGAMMISRRRFIGFCGKVLAAFLGKGAVDSFFAPKATATILPMGRYLPRDYWEYLPTEFFRQLVGENPAVRFVMWQSDELQHDAKVELRRDSDQTAVNFPAAYEYAEFEGEGWFIYTARLTGIEAKEDYSVRVFADNAASDWTELAQPNERKLRLLVFCDSQCVDYDVWRKVLRAAQKRHAADAFTVIGDLVDNGQAPWQWRGWFKAAKDALRQKIFIPVMGNHECYDLNWLNCLPTGYLREFAAVENGSADFRGYYYCFDMGAARFFVLNTQAEELDGIKGGLFAEQQIWLNRVAKNCDKPWRIVLMHKDILTYGAGVYDPERGGINDVGRAFMPLFDELGIDLVLTGHEHTYRNRGHIFAGRPADKGPYYVMCGLAGDQRYPNLWQDPTFDKIIAPQPETDNYLTMELTESSLRLECYLPNGKKIDDVLLKKA